jgi:hypothetical protein
MKWWIHHLRMMKYELHIAVAHIVATDIGNEPHHQEKGAHAVEASAQRRKSSTGEV